MAKKLVKNYVFNPGLGIDDNARPNAVELLERNKVFIVKEISAYIQNQIDAGNPDYTGKTYNIAKCERDSEYLIDALIFDLRYNGNEETRRVSSYYWDEDVPQIQGNRVAEIESYTYAKTLINTYILTNTSAPNPEQSVAVQYIDTDLTSESGTTTRVTTLLDDVVDVISGGLDVLPSLEIGLGRIEILGKIQLEEILVITNVTDGVIVYNFVDPNKGGRVTFNAGNSESYPQAFSINEGTTIVNFKTNTSSMSITDDIQIFIEDNAQKVQMKDINSDAMERIKVGIPQAMLDADFEYGLQPTKWQAIATERGYPSTYEIPASDLQVASVSTDASLGTSGVGASLITVTTTTAHQLEPGSVFTIRALSSSIIGFNRAEGTFLVNTVPTSRSFTYYAKSKVGTTSGQILATDNTQLRKADFYTGANVSEPTFSIPTQGGSGTFLTALDAPAGTSNLTFIGNAPVTGIVLSGTNIASGTQVSGVFGGNNTDGVETTAYVASDFTSGGSTIELVSTTGISAGMIVSSDGTANGQQRVITSIESNILTLDGAISANYTGDNQTYTGLVLSSSNYIQGTGTGATFDFVVSGGRYALQAGEGITGIATPGSGYIVGDTVLVAGTSLGGTSPTNDLYLTVGSVTELGGVTSATITSFQGEGSAIGAEGTQYNGVASTQTTPPSISNATVSIGKFNGSYIVGSVTNGGSGFAAGNRFLIPGTSLGGTTPTNDCTVIVSVFSTDVNDFTVSGTAARGDQIDIYGGISISQAITNPILEGSLLSYSGLAVVQVDFSENHGLLPGSAVLIEITSSGTGHTLASGPFFIDSVPILNRFTYIPRTAGTIDVTTDDLVGNVYIRPDAYFSHRPYDGGVQLSTGSPQHGNQAIRMSKKYIRYQSGKGVMYNTGALFAPSFDIASMTATGTAVGSIITVETDDADHGLQSGATIRINGSQTVGYDGDYTVTAIIDERTFRVEAQSALGSTTAILGSQCQMSLLYWHGAVVRSGCFDDQNGIFWQYDGQRMAVGRRTSTFQCAGTIAVNANGNTVTGTNTRFTNQLQAGDRIVIKGMTHVVSHIASDTVLSITPGFRGVNNITGTKTSKVQDLIIPQNEWNIDRCDGTGPSGYNIDVTKMQMIGIQFTWYGAGFIDWMLRGPDGNYIFCHRLKGNNINTEAYMRTGNVPVRYEVTNEGARSFLTSNITGFASTIELDDVSDFPDSGTVYIAPELIRYTGKNNSTNTLTGCSRGTTLSNFAGGSTRSYTGGSAQSHNIRDGVVLVSSTTSPIISHWGSAYLIDGQFDEDRGYIFNYAETGLEISTVKKTAFMIRLAPSVSNAITGDLGTRELLNRAQLLLSGIEITSDGTDPDNSNAPILGGLVIEGVLNPSNYPINPADVQWQGLTTQSQGGQPSFAQVASSGAINWGTPTVSTQSATVQGQITATFDLVNSTGDLGSGRYAQNNDEDIYIDDADYDGSGIETGDGITHPAFNSGTTILGISENHNGNGFTRLRLSRSANNNDTTNSTVVITKQNTTNSYRSSNIFFTRASWETAATAGVTLGTPISTSDTNWPAGTVISSVSNLLNLGTTQYYAVSFNNTSSNAVAAASTVLFDLSPPIYALPGETVFSLIAQAGELASLDLNSLKELTTTTLGGRGTFPNGPDVLAVNIYKVSGASTNANLMLRWSEAQA